MHPCGEPVDVHEQREGVQDSDDDRSTNINRVEKKYCMIYL